MFRRTQASVKGTGMLRTGPARQGNMNRKHHYVNEGDACWVAAQVLSIWNPQWHETQRVSRASMPLKGKMWSFKRLKVLILGCSVNICCRLQSLGEEGREKQMNVLGGRMTVGPKKSEHEVCPSWELRSRRTQQAVLWTRLMGPLLQGAGSQARSTG